MTQVPLEIWEEQPYLNNKLYHIFRAVLVDLELKITSSSAEIYFFLFISHVQPWAPQCEMVRFSRWELSVSISPIVLEENHNCLTDLLHCWGMCLGYGIVAINMETFCCSDTNQLLR